MQHSGELTAVAIVFWVFVAVVSIAGMIQDYRKRKLALEPIRIAIEHGQQLSPEIIATLLGREERDKALDPRLLEVGGIITCAAGVGVAFVSIFLSGVFPPYHLVVMGVGVVAICVGIGLIIAAKSLRR
jgi:Domain of unknown function (DUF6249)